VPSSTTTMPSTHSAMGPRCGLQELDEAKPLRHAMHVDVSVAREHVEARLAAALAAGGRVVDDSNAAAHWTLADRAGNRVCICAWPDGATGPGPLTAESSRSSPG
jgi:4a-hydroxytetrahydrobiopterin dehydratase